MEEVGGLHARALSCSSGQVVALPEAANTPWVNWLLRQDPASSLLQLLSEARTAAQQRRQGQATPVDRACCTPKAMSCCQGDGILHKESLQLCNPSLSAAFIGSSPPTVCKWSPSTAPCSRFSSSSGSEHRLSSSIFSAELLNVGWRLADTVRRP